MQRLGWDSAFTMVGACNRYSHFIRSCAHTECSSSEDKFSFHLGYPFINYDFPSDDDNRAETLFTTAFDKHTQLQEETYLADHEELMRS